MCNNNMYEKPLPLLFILYIFFALFIDKHSPPSFYYSCDYYF